MQFNVAGLLKSSPGDTRAIELDEWLALTEPDLEVSAPVRGRVRLIRDPAGVLVVGQLATRLRTECARCLEPVEVELVVDLCEQFRPTVFIPGGPSIEAHPDAQEWATEIDAHHQLDLSEVVRQGILLASPLHPLCRPDCRGLCPRCGADLNDGPCDCPPESGDTRWAELRRVLDDLTTEPGA